ncbi:hypothetical protein DAMA08_016610 [Martiniozyma asiatica (nom. inval.)]|nr:hypothetical protein DAMA08_016610 [Martiniozyma asiatica]
MTAPNSTLCVDSPKTIIQFLKYARKLDDSIQTTLNETQDCSAFVKDVLRPTWEARESILEECIKLTASMPTAPQMVNLKIQEQREVEDAQKAINESLRVNPYALRDQRERQSDLDELHLMYQREAAIEKVVRKRTVDVIRDVCGFDAI